MKTLSNMKANRAILVLEDGSTYYGWSFNSSSTVSGEVVFNTGMTGYQEVITDPSYSEQIINFTYPELGNTGINSEDMESQFPLLKGLIAKNICSRPSNWRHSMSLLEYLVRFQIMHIYGVDTRAITKHLRNVGTLNGSISSSSLKPSVLLKNLKNIQYQKQTDLVFSASTKKPYTFTSCSAYEPFYFTNQERTINIREDLHILVMDFGVKYNILRYLDKYVNNITVVPADISYKDIVNYKPDGILLSNGPGNPEDLYYAICTVKKLLHYNIPLLGICMGHQILSLALGLEAFKLKFGHRGLNHPVGYNKSISITSQNHGFAIKKNETTPSFLITTETNFNDHTVAGISHRNYPYFSVQYHPESSPGPHDADNLFLHFIRVIVAMQKWM
uniref:Carbamoyl phosphate synthase small chain n=1 Tax=Acrochaetium secundatum TaxID=209631 RepID=A0A4D6BKM8_9FLOR|nr:carbamoyl phosphate synthase small subunit [Acrochaetium secundatum]QBX88340.1 carbamoyl phosphate synthase small subunit [Acrochaetium secundatum]